MCIVETHHKDLTCFPKDTSKSKRKPRLVFVEALKRAVWNVWTVRCFIFFLNFFYGGVSLVYLNAYVVCRLIYVASEFMEGLHCGKKSSLLWQKQDFLKWLLAMPHTDVVLWTSQVRRDARLEYRTASVTVVQMVHVSVAAKSIAKGTPWNEELFLSISFKFY